MGTTRMHDLLVSVGSIATAKVHGFGILYVAGSSVGTGDVSPVALSSKPKLARDSRAERVINECRRQTDKDYHVEPSKLVARPEETLVNRYNRA